MLIMLLTPSLGMAMGILLAGNETSLPLVPWLFGLAGVAVGIPLLGLLILLPRLIMDSRAERRAWEAKQS